MNNKQTFKRLGSITAVFLILTSLFLTQQKSDAQEPVLPAKTPIAEEGLILFSQRCAACHGVTAAGDGEAAISAGLAPVAFADPQYRLNANPQQMFDKISNGNLAQGMPPFGASSSNPIAEQDRWNLIAAAYSFSTPADSIALGAELVAAQEDVQFPDAAYWFTTSNADAIADLVDGAFGFDATELSAEEQIAVVDYGRSQTYTYTDPFAAAEPIPLATIGGQVVNGATTELVTEGVASLRAFTFDLEETLTLETELDENGRFQFDLTDVDPDWVYLTTVTYGDLSFNSEANQLQRDNPVLEMPIIVYDTTADPTVISIEQLHLILNFAEDKIEVSEFYLFSNEDTAVFVGESDNATEGVAQLFLPAGAENVTFQRAFGSFDNFIPATELIKTETGWADTIPIRPGAASANLLVSYELPYKDGLQLAHPLAYTVNSASATMPDIGVDISDGNWQAEGTTQNTLGSNILSFANNNIADTLNLTLQGKPQLLIDGEGNAIVLRDNNQELIIGVIVLLLTIIIAAVILYKWRQPIDETAEINEILNDIAELDDAYATGEIEESKYQHQRERLKGDLATIWQTK